MLRATPPNHGAPQHPPYAIAMTVDLLTALQAVGPTTRRRPEPRAAPASGQRQDNRHTQTAWAHRLRP
eukprot:4399210-Lingulodinium_polyedra.AAC.1